MNNSVGTGEAGGDGMWHKLPNGGIEREIHQHLKQQGWKRKQYQLRGIELIAVERPGWKQIFQFELAVQTADQQAAWNGKHVQGLIRDDHRQGSELRLLADASEREAVLQVWGAGMIHRRVSERPMPWLSAGLVCLGLLLLIGTLFWLNGPPG